jgi:hypothetical protein
MHVGRHRTVHQRSFVAMLLCVESHCFVRVSDEGCSATPRISTLSMPPSAITAVILMLSSLYYLLSSLYIQSKFDVHLTGMEEAMRSIRREGEDVKLLRRNLDIGLAKAMSVLDDTQTRCDNHT